ncbi:hypothetical protein [Winslowiella toletana]|uniref:hypothetical protein n=1 Tax=Winslowiella toletana TaxID=92490 RepID=UPI0028BEA681|nr:hypothetical protein [Winslowiella toletana]WNN42806.1 hypothetical protein RIN69_13895 [Winslowiella toletana]
MSPYSPEKFPITRQVCEEFVIRQVSIHRRPVYRSAYGDILIDADCLASMLTSYFMADDMDAGQVERKFFQMLDIYNLNKPEYFATIGRYEGLNKPAVEELTEILDYFASKVADGSLPSN